MQGSALSEKVMVASFLEAPKEGEQFSALPAHLTYVSWFDVSPGDRDALYDRIEDIIAEEGRAPVITGGSHRIFTDAKTGALQRVRRLDVPTNGFNAVHDFSPHAALVMFAKNTDPSLDMTFFGLDWAPHVSDTPDRSLAQGEVVQLDNLTVVRRLKMGQKIVDRVFDWRNDE